jgi:xylan 1,4-beta-xylosidase
MKKVKLRLPVLISFFVGISSFYNAGIAQSPSFESYMNPVIPGDHPDATLTRIGNDYYTTGSSFNPTPVIYHSTDLVHWEALAQPVSATWSGYEDRPGGGCWGGHIVLYKGTYWDFFGHNGRMYFVTADDPKGPWNSPTEVISPTGIPGLGMDNSIFIDGDTAWYMLVKNGQTNNWIVQLGDNGQAQGAIYNLTWINPAPDYPYSWAEGPVMWKYKDYYYYSFARDVSGGQKVMRSHTLTSDQGAWELLGDLFDMNDPDVNSSRFGNPNHASPVVTLPDSTFWVIHPVWAKDEWRGQGRQGLLNQLHYDADLRPLVDYPVDKPFTAPALPSSGIPWMVPKSDFFTSDVLNPEWSLEGYTPDNTWSLTDRPGWLRLSPKSNTHYNTIVKNDGEHNYSLITRLEFDPASGKEAGLRILRGDTTQYVKLFSTLNSFGRDVIIFSFNGMVYETDNTPGNTLWLKIVRINHSISGFFSKNGNDWKQVGNPVDIQSIDSYTDPNFVAWEGTRQGLYVRGSTAYFDLYIYRDAYTPILAECPANQYGTAATTKTDGIYQLDSIHNNDWALYAGVQFGNDEYLKSPKAIEVTASSAGTGGTVEVWLDSIASGTKVAECVISGTGDWNTFETFTAPVDPVQGRHDVYLRFTGAGSGRLFKLKWINFQANKGPELLSAAIANDDTLTLTLDQPVVTPVLPSGLTITANGTEDIPISDISLADGDSSQLVLSLDSLITDTDELTISYSSGTIMDPAGIPLMPFAGLPVDNQLPGAIPKIKLLETKDEGDTVWMQLSKKMNSPASFAGDFIIEIEGKEDIQLSSAGLAGDDSTTLLLIPESRLYYEDNIILSYSGTDLESVNGGFLPVFDSIPVRNVAEGYPPQIVSSFLRKSGSKYRYIDLRLDRPMQDASSEKEYFSIALNDQPATIISITTGYDSLSFYISKNIEYGHVIKMSYSEGNVRSRYNGKLAYFTDYLVTNTIPEPVDISIQHSETSDVLVFPNPAQSEIEITWDLLFTRLMIYNLEGKELVHLNYDIPRNTTHVSMNLEAGVYLLMLGNNYTCAMKKLIIE